MAKRHGTLVGAILSALGDRTGLFEWPPQDTDAWGYKQIAKHSRKNIYDTVYNLQQRGLIREISKNGKKFIELTKKGQLEQLFVKVHDKIQTPRFWDGKWRLAIFDIPEDTKDKRDKLRRLLNTNGFTKWQASVFISPYQLNREAVDYLKVSGLIEFIHLARIDELDDDTDLRKKFKLA